MPVFDVLGAPDFFKNAPPRPGLGSAGAMPVCELDGDGGAFIASSSDRSNDGALIASNFEMSNAGDSGAGSCAGSLLCEADGAAGIPVCHVAGDEAEGTPECDDEGVDAAGRLADMPL
jgi:hypothetical protein